MNADYWTKRSKGDVFPFNNQPVSERKEKQILRTGILSNKSDEDFKKPDNEWWVGAIFFFPIRNI